MKSLVAMVIVYNMCVEEDLLLCGRFHLEGITESRPSPDQLGRLWYCNEYLNTYLICAPYVL